MGDRTRAEFDAELEAVQDLMLEAANTLRSLPRVGPGGYRQFWPKYDLEEEEIGPRMSMPMCTHEQMDERLAALRGCDPEGRKVLWSRLGRGVFLSWRKVAHRVGKSHQWCRILHIEALRSIQKTLQFQSTTKKL